MSEHKPERYAVEVVDTYNKGELINAKWYSRPVPRYNIVVTPQLPWFANPDFYVYLRPDNITRCPEVGELIIIERDREFDKEFGFRLVTEEEYAEA